MHSRTIRAAVTFAHPFRLQGHEDLLPAGTYDVLTEETLLEGLSFEAYRRTAVHLLVRTRGSAEMRPINPDDLEAAQSRDRAQSDHREPSDAALPAQEDLS